MNDVPPAPRYAILVTQRGDSYELRIPELLLTVKATDLADGHERLRRREREIVEQARRLGTLDELPAPVGPPALGATLG